MIVVIFMHKLLRVQDNILSLLRLNCLNIKVFNTLRSRQNGRHFAGDIFKHISWLAHWSQVTCVCVSNQAIIWTYDGILLIGPIGITWSSMKFLSKFMHFHSRNSSWKPCLENGSHFASTFNGFNGWKCVYFSFKYIAKGPIDNRPASVHIMACYVTGNKPLSKPMIA